MTAERMASGMARIISQILTVAAVSAPWWSVSSFWNSLSALQWAAAISALILTIGAVIEYWHKLKALTLLACKWTLRKSTAFDRCTFRKLVIHSIGPLLVTFGIAGDFIFEGRAFILEDKQEEQARKTLGSLQDKEIAVSTEADELSRRLDGMETGVRVAKESAGEAQDKVRDVEKRADKLSTDLDDSLAKQVALEKELQIDEKKLFDTAAFAETLKAATSRLAYRIGQRTFNREATVSFLRDRAKGNADIWYKKTDNREPFLFAQELKNALDEGGWNTSELHELTTEVLERPPWNTIKKSRQIGAVLIMRRPPGFPTFRDPTPIGVIATVLIGGPDFGLTFNGEFDPSLTEDHVILGIFEAAKP